MLIYFSNVNGSKSIITDISANISVPDLEPIYHKENLAILLPFGNFIEETLSILINTSLSIVNSSRAQSVIILNQKINIEKISASPFGSGVLVDSATRDLCMTLYEWTSLGYYPIENLLVELYKISTSHNTPLIERSSYKEIFNIHWSNKSIKHIDFVADSGMGKTTLLHACLEKIKHYSQQLYPNNKTNLNKYWYEEVAISYGITNKDLPTIIARIIDKVKNQKLTTVFVIDNLQWVDHFSLIIIKRLVLEVDNFKLITASRPSNRDLITDKKKYEKIEVFPFSKQECKLLVKKKGLFLTQQLFDRVLKKSNCHPLLVNEFLSRDHSSSDELDDLNLIRSNNSNYKQLADKLFHSNNSTKISDDLMELLFLISKIEIPVSSIFIQDLISSLDIETSLKDFIELPFIDQTGIVDYYYFKHDYYIQAVLVTYKKKNQQLLIDYATFLSSKGKLLKAAILFQSTDQLEIASNTLLQAADKAHLHRNYAELLEISELWSSNTWLSTSSDKMNQKMFWYSGFSQNQLGILESSAHFFKMYLEATRINCKLYHILYIPLMCAGISNFPSYSRLRRSTEEANMAAYASRVITELSSFKAPPIKVLLQVLRYYLVSKYVSTKYETIGEPEAYLAITLAPLSGYNMSRLWIKRSLNISRTGEDYARLRALILKVNYDGYTMAWNRSTTMLRLNRYIKLAGIKHHYKTVIYGVMFKIVFQLCKGQPNLARKSFDEELMLFANHVAKWLKDWMTPVNLSIMIEDSMPERILYYTKYTYPIEVKAGCEQFFASAFMARGDLDACKKSICCVLEHYGQLQYTAHFFSLNIIPLLETILYLELNESLSTANHRKLTKACKLHCKLIYRSKPIFIGYKGVRYFAKGKQRRGLKLINKAITMSQQRGNIRGVILFNLHMRFAIGDSVKRDEDWPGMYARLKSLWATIRERI